MQLFIRNRCPVLAVVGDPDDPTDEPMCDQWVNKMGTEAAQLAWSVAHALDMPWINDKVPGPLGRQLPPWKPLSKGHLQHECYLWALANPHHLYWVIRHGLACCIEYTKRSAGAKIHATEWQLRHLARQFGKPEGKCAMTPDAFLAQLDPELRERKFPDKLKFCSTNPPEGCLFGILAGPTRISDDCVACYRAYCEEKKTTFKVPMRWSGPGESGLKRKRVSHE